MKIFKINADNTFGEKEIENTLEAMHKEVGGYIETVTLPIRSSKKYVVICNEEGRIRGLKDNVIAEMMLDINFVGDIFICTLNDAGELADLPESDIEIFEQCAHIANAVELAYNLMVENDER